MAEYLIQDTTLTGIADAIRSRTGGVDSLSPASMPNEILYNISSEIHDIETVEEMDALLIDVNIGKAYRYVGETTDVYINGDIYVVEEL